MTAVFSAAATIGRGQAGFHSLAWAAAMLPWQCAALLWAWQRRCD
ncbi:putative membrane protein [Synechococcus sp. RS9915]|nr:putative membrane protein [Synechococcus sp. RS9915]QNJ15288.1 putative membrane protein [Synechococcus sp. A18-46.1]